MKTIENISQININYRPVNADVFNKKSKLPSNDLFANATRSKTNNTPVNKTSKMREMIRGTYKEKTGTAAIIENTLANSDALKASRSNTKKTSSALKQLRYNYKAISSQIVRSKTSVNCKQVASKARREVVNLKLKLQTGNYDTEELQAAITHAESMERLAKKKAHHLEQEELIKVTGGPGPKEFEEKNINNNYGEDTSSESTDPDQIEKNMSERKTAVIDQMMRFEEIQEISEEQMDELLELSDEFMDEMEDMISEVSDAMEEIADFLGDFEAEMDPDDYHLLIIKHRTSEAKDMAKADGEYLKTMFQHYQSMGSTMPSAFSGYSGMVDTFNALNFTV